MAAGGEGQRAETRPPIRRQTHASSRGGGGAGRGEGRSPCVQPAPAGQRCVGGVGKRAEQEEVGGVTGSVDNSGEGCNLARPGSWHKPIHTEGGSLRDAAAVSETAPQKTNSS